jgi:hypothetical protein
MRMDLKEAIQIAGAETRAEGGTTGVDVDGQKMAVEESGLLSEGFMGLGLGRRERDLVCCTLLFGMRVQRKLDHPERVTTYRHAIERAYPSTHEEPSALCFLCGRDGGCHHNLHECRIFPGRDWHGLCRRCADENEAKWKPHLNADGSVRDGSTLERSPYGGLQTSE